MAAHFVACDYIEENGVWMLPPTSWPLGLTIGFKQMYSLKKNSTLVMIWEYSQARYLWFGMETIVCKYGFQL